MNTLIDYIQNPDNDIYNFNLACVYDQNKQYSPASSFYLRCAEKTQNINLRYECLLRLYMCYKALGGRDTTCEILLKQAISICPNKPEAYFLIAQYYEYKNDWISMYTQACVGSQFSNNQTNFLSKIEFPGSYVFIFQKAISAWRIGKPDESRKLFFFLLEHHIDELSDYYRKLLEVNLSQLGSGPESQAIRKYTQNLKHKLKFSFDNIDSVDQNFSQVYQDMFVLTTLNGKRNGTYLEIGASEPFKNSNTALLETKFDWTGVGVEYNSSFTKQHENHRKNQVINTDALIIDYKKLLNKYFPNQNTIDYLQLDIEPPRNTYEALLSIPFDIYKFAVITYEHDYYVDITRSYRNKSREYLNKLGYLLIVPNISPNENSPFEDWWVHPELISPEIIQVLKCDNLDSINPVESYYLNN